MLMEAVLEEVLPRRPSRLPELTAEAKDEALSRPEELEAAMRLRAPGSCGPDR